MADLSHYHRKLKCLDLDAIQVQGDYNSPRARQLVFLFERCDPETFTQGECQSDEAITDWIRRKFVIIYFNQMRFNTLEYAENGKISREAKLVYIPINSQLREEIVYQVQLTNLQLQDEYYQFSHLTEDETTIFNHFRTVGRPYEFKDRMHVQVTFEFDLTLYRIDRDVYSLLDLIGDLGGLAEGLFIILAIILGLLTFNDFDHFLIEHLYGKYDEQKVLVPLTDDDTRLCRQKCFSFLPQSRN